MAGRVDLLTAFEVLPRTEWSGIGYRHAAHAYPPLSGEGARRFGGRWNPRGSFPVLYLADSVDTVTAEFRRLAALQARALSDFLPRALHTIECNRLELLDLRDPDPRRSVGLSDADLFADDRAACQSVGEAAEFLGYQGVLAPSAAGPTGGFVIAVFLDRIRPGALTVAATTDFDPGAPGSASS